MPNVRALAATDFYPGGNAPAVAMFEGQIYDVPEAEAERLVSEGLAELSEARVGVKSLVQPDASEESATSTAAQVASDPDQGDSGEGEETPKPRRIRKAAE